MIAVRRRAGELHLLARSNSISFSFLKLKYLFTRRLGGLCYRPFDNVWRGLTDDINPVCETRETFTWFPQGQVPNRFQTVLEPPSVKNDGTSSPCLRGYSEELHVHALAGALMRVRRHRLTDCPALRSYSTTDCLVRNLRTAPSVSRLNNAQSPAAPVTGTLVVGRI